MSEVPGRYKIPKKFKISQEERDLRAKKIREAIAINSVGSDEEPSEFVLKLYQKFVDGEIELEDVQDQIIKHYLGGALAWLDSKAN